MARMTRQEARERGLLGPDELAALGNPFAPRAGASWTPNLGVRPGLSASNFFRYPGISYRSGISPLRFGLGGLSQGFTLSPESPGLGLAGIAGPVGRGAISSTARLNLAMLFPVPGPVSSSVAGLQPSEASAADSAVVGTGRDARLGIAP